MPEFLVLSYIRLLGYKTFANKELLVDYFRQLRRNSGAYIGRVLLDSLYDLANREDVLEIRKGFARSNLWEKRQIVSMINHVLTDEEKRPWLKNIRQIESDEYFLREIAEPIKNKKSDKISSELR